MKPEKFYLKQDGYGGYFLCFSVDGKAYKSKPLCKPVLLGKSIEIEWDELQTKLGQVKDIENLSVGSFSELRIDFEDGTKCIIEHITTNGLS